MFMIMYMIIYIILLLIQVDRLNPIETSESSNSRPKGFSVARGQGDPVELPGQISERSSSIVSLLKSLRI
jgi:hypothetical protein